MGTDLAFPVSEYEGRLRQVRAAIAARGLDLLLVTSPENVYYITGFNTWGYFAYQAALVDLEHPPLLVVRQHEKRNVEATSWVTECATYGDAEDPSEATARAIRAIGANGRRLGVEKNSWFFSVLHYERLRAALSDWEVIDASSLVGGLRLIKSEAELQYVRAGARVAEASMRAGLEAVQVGRTENDVAAAVHAAMISAGGEHPSLPPFIASSEGSSRPHVTWRGITIREGDAVLLEIPGCVKRYTAVINRCVVLGRGTEQLRSMADAAIGTLDELIAQLRPGMTSSEADRLCHNLLGKRGFEMRRRTGYSIGISFPPDWGEWDVMNLVEGDERELRPGMVFHIPISVRVLGVAGVSASETVLITRAGCEALTQFSRQVFFRE